MHASALFTVYGTDRENYIAGATAAPAVGPPAIIYLSPVFIFSTSSYVNILL